MREPVEPQLFLSFFEHPGPDTATLYVRTTHSPDNMFAALRRTVQEIDPGLPLFRMRTMEEQVERSLANERLMSELSATFGLFATLLTVVGLYGLIANAVIQRRREIGIRMALGAASGEVTWLFLREALGLVVLGCALALPILWALGSYMRSQLYGIEPLDGTTVVVTVIALGAIAAAGSFLPALRGARIQPLTVLRRNSASRIGGSLVTLTVATWNRGAQSLRQLDRLRALSASSTLREFRDLDEPIGILYMAMDVV